MAITCRTVFTLVLIGAIVMPAPAWALKCYECGHYLPRSDGADRFVPCEHYNSSHLTECKSQERSCLRLFNQGLILLQCSANCIPDINHFTEREIHCCNRDACNGSANLKLSSIQFYLLLVAIVSFGGHTIVFF